jgi:hypothetical protein
MVAVAKPSAAECRARATSRGYVLRSPRGGGLSRISGAGADADRGVHRMPGISPRVNSRSRTSSSRRCSVVNCMVVPFGSAMERRSWTTYRPTVAPEGSIHLDTFTGTTSSLSCTAPGNVAVAAVVPPTGCAGHPGRTLRRHYAELLGVSSATSRVATRDGGVHGAVVSHEHRTRHTADASQSRVQVLSVLVNKATGTTSSGNTAGTSPRDQPRVRGDHCA